MHPLAERARPPPRAVALFLPQPLPPPPPRTAAAVHAEMPCAIRKPLRGPLQAADRASLPAVFRNRRRLALSCSRASVLLRGKSACTAARATRHTRKQTSANRVVFSREPGRSHSVQRGPRPPTAARRPSISPSALHAPTPTAVTPERRHAGSGVRCTPWLPNELARKGAISSDWAPA